MVNADLENLIVLQAQDLELQRLRAELAEAPQRIKAAQAALVVAQNALSRCQAALATEEKLRRSHESAIASHRSKLERLRRSLDSATSAQQVSAFEHEITFASAAIDELEEQAFASLERSDGLEREAVEAQTAVSQAQAAFTAEQGRAAAVKLKNEEGIVGVERERVSLRATIPPARLASYDRLAKARGTAVAEAIGNATSGKCAACQMGIRPQRWQDLIGREYPDEIFNCETCGRLLFWDPRRDTPRAWTAGDRLNSAQAGAVSPARAGGSR